MVAFRIEDFGGLVPRRGVRLLPANAAFQAVNTRILSGELRGFHAPSQYQDLSAVLVGQNAQRAYRIPGTPDTWIAYASKNTDIVRSPLLNDQYDRYFVASDAGRPVYNTKARIAAGSPFYYLGVPLPAPATWAFHVGSPPAVANNPVVRAYVFTYVTAYGEEGPPSAPIIGTGDALSNWLLDINTVVPNAANRNMAGINIYRTIPGYSSSLFFRLHSGAGTTVNLTGAPVSTYNATYTDLSTNSDDVVALNPTLESTTWIEPPTDMKGFIAMPNGYLVGFVGRRLLFSEPYRPHAWPAEYELATEFNIVGLGEFNGTLLVGTESNPYIGSGIAPSSFTLQKTDSIEPCLSRRGVVSTSYGVLYPSPNGMVMAGPSGINIITQGLLTKDEWRNQYSPSTIIAAQYGTQYLAFFGPNNGFLFSPAEQAQKWVDVSYTQNVDGIETDKYTGDIYILSQDIAWTWDPPTTENLFWTWTSKEFHFPKPINIGAIKIKWEVGIVDLSGDVSATYQPYNTVRFANPLPLDTLGGHVLNGIQSPGLVAGWAYPENSFPLGGSTLYNLLNLSSQTLGVILTVYANREIVFQKTVYDETIVRLPSGFKADIWQFSLSSNSEVYSMQVAETGKELATV